MKKNVVILLLLAIFCCSCGYITDPVDESENTIVTFNFGVSTPSHIKITLENSAGDVIKTITNSYYAANIYWIEVDMKGMKKGSYIVRLQNLTNGEEIIKGLIFDGKGYQG